LSQTAYLVATAATVTVVVDCVVVLSTTVTEADKVEMKENFFVLEARGTRVDVLTYVEVDITVEGLGSRVVVDVGLTLIISTMYTVWTNFVPKPMISPTPGRSVMNCGLGPIDLQLTLKGYVAKKNDEPRASNWPRYAKLPRGRLTLRAFGADASKFVSPDDSWIEM